MSQVLRPANLFFASNDSFQGKHGDHCSEPAHTPGPAELRTETAQSCHSIEEIDECIVRERDRCWSDGFCTQAATKLQDPHVLSFTDVDPEIGIEGCRRDTLEDSCGHPNYLKPNALLLERVNKPCERRKFS